MAISRSSFYAPPADKPDNTKIVVEMKAIADEFEAYGYRRMSAELRQRGLVVNAKMVRRLMRENGLNSRQAFFEKVRVTVAAIDV
jgi:putative transposase